ncbi:MAG: methylaspartate mutase accessory protein GlmL [Desulfitobacterium sp.]
MNNLALLIDFGSTFTKLAVFDLDAEELIGKAMSNTTIEDITIGLFTALEKLELQIGHQDYSLKLASSSAAGGLKMVAVGLVPQLTLEAAKRAALGAGANLVGTFAYELTNDEIVKIEGLSPDIVLLCGGTDGGNKKVVINNAQMLSKSSVNAPFVYAGNKVVAEKCSEILLGKGKEVIVTENVMPELGVLNVEKVRSAIREVFIKRIVDAKGLEKAKQFASPVVMPTPTAVLKAAQLIADGYGDEEGLGELMLVDVGGATTDVHSIGSGTVLQGATLKGLKEPYAKRSVEGDLGVRYNAHSIVSTVGEKYFQLYLRGAIPDLLDKVNHLKLHPKTVPITSVDQELDTALAKAAVDIATDRHVGSIQEVQMPFEKVYIQEGKNLLEINYVIGTGGPLVNNPCPRSILEMACRNHQKPQNLKPIRANFLLDEKYILYACGLLSEVFPQKALRIAKKYLEELKVDGD